MPRRIAVDTGPIVAFFVRDDLRHADMAEFVRSATFPLFTTVPVLTEVMHLLSFSVIGRLKCLEWLQRGVVEIVDLRADDWARVAQLIEKYADLPMDFADASLIAACERLDTRLVASIDSHFEIYRFRDRQRFENLFPQ